MSVNASNLILGPAKLYVSPFGTTEPADTSITPNGASFIPSAPWTDVGGTDGGVTFEVDSTYTDLAVDQIIMNVGARLTDIKMTVAAKLAEVTLANLNTALNSIGTTGGGSGYSTLDIPVTSAASQPTYAALLVVGWAPGSSMARWVIVRKLLCQTKAMMTYDKKGQLAYDCTWNAFYVSSTIPPVHITDELT